MRGLRNDQYALFFLTLWVLWTFFSIFNFVLFFKNRQSIYIKNRDPWLIFCSALGQYAMTTSSTWRIVLLPQNYPNMLDLWFLWLFIPLHFLPYPVRSLRFVIQSAYNKYQYKKLKAENGEHVQNALFDFLQKHPSLRGDMAYFILNWILMAVAIIWGLTRNIKLPENHPGQYGLENSNAYYISCTVLLIVASFFLWLAVHFLRKTGEELYVTAELATIGILWLIFISLYIIFAWKKIGVFQLAPILLIVLCIASFCISFGMPIQLAIVVKKYRYKEELEDQETLLSSSRLNVDVDIDTIKTDSILDNDDKGFNSPQMSKEQELKTKIEERKVEILNKYKRLKGVIEDDKAYDLLFQFCQNKMCPEYILFYKDVVIYKSLPDDQIRPKFEEMVKNYVKDDANFHINILVTVLRKVENTTEPNKDTFNEMKAKVDYLVQVEIFPPFRRWPAFEKYIKDKEDEAEREERNKLGME